MNYQAEISVARVYQNFVRKPFRQTAADAEGSLAGQIVKLQRTEVMAVGTIATAFRISISGMLLLPTNVTTPSVTLVFPDRVPPANKNSQPLRSTTVFSASPPEKTLCTPSVSDCGSRSDAAALNLLHAAVYRAVRVGSVNALPTRTDCRIAGYGSRIDIHLAAVKQCLFGNAVVDNVNNAAAF